MRFGFYILVLLFFLSGCLRYKEDWNFNKDGSGAVTITCEPSPNWQNYTKASSWQAASTLFLPDYSSISQSCANAGVTINKCKYQTKRRRPKAEISLSFNSLKDLSACGLFSERILQWRRGKLKSLFFYKINLNQDHFSTGKTSLADKNWLSDGRATFIFRFPDKVIEVKGAQQRDNRVIASFPFSDFEDKRNIIISAKIKAFPPVLQWLIISLSVAAFLIIVFFILKKWYNIHGTTPKKEIQTTSEDSKFHGQFW